MSGYTKSGPTGTAFTQGTYDFDNTKWKTQKRDYFANGQLPGDLSGAAANAGCVGEVIRAELLVGSETTLTTATPRNVCSITLTPGDWNVVAMLALDPALATTVLQAGIAAISKTSANLGGGGYATPISGECRIELAAANATGGSVASIVIPPYRALFSVSTQLWLVAEAFFTIAGMNAYGSIEARRMR